MDFREISNKIYEHTEDRERMEAMNELYYEMAETVKKQMPSVYEEFTENASNILWKITPEEAREIVRGMRPSGEKWSDSEVYTFIEAKGIEPSVDYYLAINMAFNDYRNTGIQFDVDTPEFYFSLAKDFIKDEDGVPHKVARYFSL